MRKYINKYWPYELFTLASIFMILILGGLTKFLLQIFDQYIPESVEFIELFPILLLLTHFLISVIFFNRIKPMKANLGILLLIYSINYILFSIPRLIDFSVEIIINLTGLVLIFICFILGYIFKVSANPFYKILSALTTIVFIFLVIKFIQPRLSQIQNHGSLIGTYSKKIDTNKVQFYDKDHNEVDIQDESYLLDFWSNTCGVCIKKFPKIKEFKSDYEFMDFYLVNVIDQKSDIKKAEGILDERNLDLKNIYLYKDDLRSFDVEYFPTVLMIEEKEIVLKGSIETVKYFLYYHFDDQDLSEH